MPRSQREKRVNGGVADEEPSIVGQLSELATKAEPSSSHKVLYQLEGTSSGNQSSVTTDEESEEVKELGFLPVLRNRNFWLCGVVKFFSAG